MEKLTTYPKSLPLPVKNWLNIKFFRWTATDSFRINFLWNFKPKLGAMNPYRLSYHYNIRKEFERRFWIRKIANNSFRFLYNICKKKFRRQSRHWQTYENIIGDVLLGRHFKLEVYLVSNFDLVVSEAWRCHFEGMLVQRPVIVCSRVSTARANVSATENPKCQHTDVF